MWAGVDVGGRRKGFDVAVVDGALAVTLFRSRDVAAVVAHVDAAGAVVVGVDAPCAWADPGERSRRCEREFAALGLCGIRYSPDERTARARRDGYLEWIWNGLELWRALDAAGLAAIECFPTASWTAWFGGRDGDQRARWTRAGVAALAAQGVTGLAAATTQDQRDAVAAALTARQWSRAPASTHLIDRFAVARRGTLADALA